MVDQYAPRAEIDNVQDGPYQAPEQESHDVGPDDRTPLVWTDPRFVKLRRRFGVQLAVIVTVSLGWYIGYLFLSATERDFMGMSVVGSVNVAFLLGIGQFASAFVLAWLHGRYSHRRLDPLADEIRAGLPDPRAHREGRPARR